MAGTGKPGWRCRTPGTVYETDIQPDTITLKIMLPHPIAGDLTRDEHSLVVKQIHDAALPTIEWLFSRAWDEHFANKPLTDHDLIMPASHEEL